MDLVCQEVRKADRNITNHPSLYRDVGISDGISVFLTWCTLYISNKKTNSSKGIIKSAWWVKSRGNPLWTEAKLDSTNCLRQGREVWKSWCHGISLPSVVGWPNWSKHLSLWWQLEITHGLPMYVNLTEKIRSERGGFLNPNNVCCSKIACSFRTAVVRTLRSARLWAERAACRATLLWLWSLSRSRSWSNRELHEKVSGHQRRLEISFRSWNYRTTYSYCYY